MHSQVLQEQFVTHRRGGPGCASVPARVGALCSLGRVRGGCGQGGMEPYRWERAGLWQRNPQGRAGLRPELIPAAPGQPVRQGGGRAVPAPWQGSIAAPRQGPIPSPMAGIHRHGRDLAPQQRSIPPHGRDPSHPTAGIHPIPIPPHSRDPHPSDVPAAFRAVPRRGHSGGAEGQGGDSGEHPQPPAGTGGPGGLCQARPQPGAQLAAAGHGGSRRGRGGGGLMTVQLSKGSRA